MQRMCSVGFSGTQVTPFGLLTVLLFKRLPALELVTGDAIKGWREYDDGTLARLYVARSPFGPARAVLSYPSWRLLLTHPLTARVGVVRLSELKLDGPAVAALTGPESGGVRRLEVDCCELDQAGREGLGARFGQALVSVC
jgi:hypothetical protein